MSASVRDGPVLRSIARLRPWPGGRAAAAARRQRTSTPTTLGAAVTRVDYAVGLPSSDLRRLTEERPELGGQVLARPVSMLHYPARSVPGTLLIHDWREGLRLFHGLLARAPGADLVVMPDHFHLLTEREV